jgi:diacylglycerol kinase family enzyme
MAKIGIIINPHSKKIKKLKNPVEYYRNICGNSADIKLTITLDDITKAAEYFKKQGISYLAISGGDGSIHHVLSKFINVYKNTELPAILVLRDGSMNFIAKSYNLRGKGHELIKKLVNSVNNNSKISIVNRKTIKVNNMYCFLFGLGITANLVNEFNRGGNKNLLKILKLILMLLLSLFFKKYSKIFFKTTKLKVIIDGEEIKFSEVLGIYAATIANLATGIKLTPRAYEKENTFHLIATGMKPAEAVLRINKIRRGKPVKHKYHYDNIASYLEIVCREKLIYQMDGDIYESAGELSVQMGPEIGFVSI